MTESQAVVLGGMVTVAAVMLTYLLLPAYRAEAAFGLIGLACAVFVYRLFR